MPKSNFNQFLHECEDCGFETRSCNNDKKNDNHETVNPNQPTENVDHHRVHGMNVNNNNNNNNNHNHYYISDHNEDNVQRSSNSILKNIFTSSSPSSNIFLSSRKNGGLSRPSLQSSNEINNKNLVSSREGDKYDKYQNQNRGQFNIFKKTDADDERGGYFSCQTSESYQSGVGASGISPIVEINDDTFPPLTASSSRNVGANITSSAAMVSNKFKNFKDAIYASSHVVPVSPMKQKTPCLSIKRDNEMRKKNILSNPKKTTVMYDSDSEDDVGVYDNSNEYNNEYEYVNRGNANISRHLKKCYSRYNNDNDTNDDY